MRRCLFRVMHFDSRMHIAVILIWTIYENNECAVSKPLYADQCIQWRVYRHLTKVCHSSLIARRSYRVTIWYSCIVIAILRLNHIWCRIDRSIVNVYDASEICYNNCCNWLASVQRIRLGDLSGWCILIVVALSLYSWFSLYTNWNGMVSDRSGLSAVGRRTTDVS